jgi:hypothetical protein
MMPGASQAESEYLLQLQEKQKARFFYGVSEGQFRRVFQRALDDAQPTSPALVKLMEARLDNAVHRLGLAATRAGEAVHLTPPCGGGRSRRRPILVRGLCGRSRAYQGEERGRRPEP